MATTTASGDSGTPDDDARIDALRALRSLDLTELSDDATDEQVDALCRRAQGPHGAVAAVCVWPRHVARCAEALRGTPVRIATVVNFPSGDEPIADVVRATAAALAAGADEIDVVLPYRAFLAREIRAAGEMIDAVRDVVPRTNVTGLKVILETGELRDPAIIDRASRLAIRRGADFIKTSTGKTPISATPEATEVMLRTIAELDPSVGLKPSGGIRTLDQARVYLRQADEILGPEWVTPTTFRLGASSLLGALEAALDGSSYTAGGPGY